MECKIKNRHELISNYLLGELPEQEAKAFEEHYFQCEICFKELKVAENAINLIEQEGSSILSKDKSSYNKKGILQRLTFPGLSSATRWGIAAVVVVIIIILILIPTANKNPDEIDNEIAVKDTLSKKETLSNKEQVPQKDFAAELSGLAFKPNSYQEEWIKENIRSVNDNIDTVFSPGIGEKFYNGNIIFEWKMNEPSNGIYLKIMSNLEKEIYISDLAKSPKEDYSIKVPQEIFKESGLYYWHIEDENDVLYVGKFYFLR